MNRSGLLPIEKQVWEKLENTFSAPDNVRFIVGVSGGADSMCLLHILNRLNIPITVVHVNYAMRGEASYKDAELVEDTCKKLGVKCVVQKVETEKAEYSNFQAWGRNIRYERFEKEAKRTEATGVAVAHNRNDQIETILQKVFRGAGLAAWTGMEVWDGTLFRPLLNVSRNEIEIYCEKKSIRYRTDQTNLESIYARNFLRNEWLPRLEDHFPGWRKNVLRTKEQADIFQTALEYILDDVKTDNSELKRTPFLSLPLPLQKSLLLLLIKKTAPDSSVSIHALRQLHKLNELQTGKKLQLTERFSIMRDRSVFTLIYEHSNSAESLLLELHRLQERIYFEGVEFKLSDFSNPDFSTTLYLDIGKLRWPLKVRPCKRGDRFQPFGMKGHQSVAEHLTNRKISAAEKHNAAVIQSFEETIAAVIFPTFEKEKPPGTISEKFKCGDSTKQALIIKPKS